jgi:hypothetical protein
MSPVWLFGVVFFHRQIHRIYDGNKLQCSPFPFLITFVKLRNFVSLTSLTSLTNLTTDQPEWPDQPD